MVVTSPPITILLSDPSDVSRFGLRSLLQADRRFTVVAHVPSESVAPARRLRPDLIVLDPATSGGIDLRLVDELHRVASNTRLVILTSLFEPDSFMAAMLRRVHGYFLKDGDGQGALLLEALALVARFGVVVVDAAIAEHFWSSPGTSIAVHPPVPSVLTSREVEVLMLCIQGSTDKETAERLHLSRNTVDYHILHAEYKLGAANRLQLGWLLHDRGPL